MQTTIATWYVKAGKLDEARRALAALAKQVEETEPGTLGYLVHSGGSGSLPPTSPETIVFVEIYKDKSAFEHHLNGPAFTGFLEKHGELFVPAPTGGGAFFQVENLDRIEGFVRKAAAGCAGA